jgi:DNA/RNA endonuclease G (NUC1)
VVLIKTLEEYQAIGFVFPNDYCLNYESLYYYTRSIYAIEKLTNLQFFNDLDVSIQRKLKSEVYSEFWTNLFGEELNKIPKKYSTPTTK